jgi:hypothetical protein
MWVAFVGSGRIGGNAARLLAAAGHEVQPTGAAQGIMNRLLGLRFGPRHATEPARRDRRFRARVLPEY